MDEAMVSPAPPQRGSSVAWQVESQISGELMYRFGWFWNPNKREWEKFGKHQLVTEYGANKIFLHLLTFLAKDITLTKWPIEVIKNEILNHVNIVAADIAFDPLCGVKDEDLDTINNIVLTICRIQAYKPEGGFTMERIGEERKVLVTEKKESGKRLRDNLPFVGGQGQGGYYE